MVSRGQQQEPEKQGIVFTQLEPGEKIRTSNGDIVEVVQNPKDGYWLIVKYVSSANDPSLVGKQDMVFVYDVVEKVI